MLMSVQRDTRQEHDKLLVAGVVYLVVIAVLISLSIAIYQKAFTKVTWVTLHADNAGLQLPKFGDVRMHGVLIGQIRGISQDGKQAVIRLGLDPAQAKQIPSNADVEILPTTLFGQKYVEFMDPANPAPTAIADHTVIPSSRVHTSVELETILAKLFPLLQAVRPQDLNATLTALATALTGNGDRLGQTITQLDGYLTTMNVHLPTLRTDIQEFASVAHTYALAAPDVVSLLKNATTTANTVTQQQNQLQGLLTSVTGVANDTNQLLTTNEHNIDVETQLAVPLLHLLSTYSPEFPCLLEGLDKYTPQLNQIFRHSRVSQTMTFGGGQRPSFTKKDRPEYGAIGHGPWCLGLPNPPAVANPPGWYKDGTEDDPAQHPGSVK